MPETTVGRRSHEISTAIINRQDGSCRRFFRQRSETIDGEDKVTILVDRYFLPGTSVDEDGVVVRGPGECSRWTQAYTFKELMEIAAMNLQAQVRRVLT